MESREKAPAGGFATRRGINYQNRIAAFFAVSCLSESVGLPGLPGSPIHSIRCETGEPLADILLSFESGGLAFIEVKKDNADHGFAFETGAVASHSAVPHFRKERGREQISLADDA